MSKMTLSKGTKFIKQALIVMALTALALLLFQFVPAFAQGGLIQSTDVPSKIGAATGNQGSARALILTILDFFLGFLGLLAVIMIIYGGMLYMTASGDQQKVDKGKKILMYAIIGIVIILMSFAIVNTVLSGAGAGGDTAA
jgi:type IV secretory pathway VirB2 component (pilin)